MDRLARRQFAFNAESRGQWEAFAEHRGRVTGRLARGGTPGGSRLCVLGAGNANDLDLPVLLAAHREVHLVDLDAGALAGGAARQGVAGHPGLRLHGGVDVTSTLDLLARWHPLSAVADAELDAMASWPASRAGAALATAAPGGFDRVASTCLLSQIQETAGGALGTAHGRLAAVKAALRAGHLRLMARLAAPGGEAVLVAEVVSSAMLPGLTRVAEADLAGLLPGLLRAGNHFDGAHPRQLLATLRGDPVVGPRLATAEALSPWRWRLHDRTYLVGGVAFRLVGPPGRGSGPRDAE
jgi:hypothetical protein